jgi:pilus assembly protein Flp/PilA
VIVPATLTPSQWLAPIIGGFASAGFRRMRSVLVKVIRSDSGVSAIEYAMIGALIAIAIVTGATKVGVNISGFFTQVAQAFP